MLYWLVLLVWQNLGAGGESNKSSIDVAIKLILIIFLCVYYFMHATGIRRDILLMVWVFPKIKSKIAMAAAASTTGTALGTMQGS